MVKYLIDAGADMSAMDRCKQTALFYAITGHGEQAPLHECLRLLLAAGADVTAVGPPSSTAPMAMMGLNPASDHATAVFIRSIAEYVLEAGLGTSAGMPSSV
jgi:ankyrin repeat protein